MPLPHLPAPEASPEVEASPAAGAASAELPLQASPAEEGASALRLPASREEAVAAAPPPLAYLRKCGGAQKHWMNTPRGVTLKGAHPCTSVPNIQQSSE